MAKRQVIGCAIFSWFHDGQTMPQPQLFGYWISVKDEAGAKEAVRMSGLPVLLLGANAALLALILSVQTLPDMITIASAAIIAVLLVLLAFRMRAGHAAWIPFAIILFVAFFGASLFSSYIGWRVAGETSTASVQILLGWIIPVICSILMVGGFRGWRWMRGNKARLTF